MKNSPPDTAWSGSFSSLTTGKLPFLVPDPLGSPPSLPGPGQPAEGLTSTIIIKGLIMNYSGHLHFLVVFANVPELHQS